MSKTLATSPGALSDKALRNALIELQSGAVDRLLNTAALAIGTSKPKVLIANTIYAFISAALVKKTTAEITLSGTVTNALFNIFVLTMDAAGAVTATMGTEGATIGALVAPAVPTDEIIIGMVIINPTGTGNFVGGTTDLDDATVVPNAVYVDGLNFPNLNQAAL